MTFGKDQDTAAASAIGRAGGLKGGITRAARLTPQRRSEIAALGGLTRWANKTGGKVMWCRCGKPYRFYSHTVADQSACPACRAEIERLIEEAR